ncbi:MAG: PilZ domain-containing protein [Candidatus Korobacteraceae bacterium]
MLTDTSVTGAHYAPEKGNHYCRKLRSVNQWVQSLILMGLRKEMRLQLALPVRVFAENAEGESFEQDCTTVDLTVNGLRVEGITQTLRRGAVISVSYGAKSVPVRVMWMGPRGHVGLRAFSGWNNFWGRVIPQIPGDGFPDSTYRREAKPDRKPAPSGTVLVAREATERGPMERRGEDRYICGGAVSIWQPDAKRLVNGTVADLSLGGCYVEMMTPLNVHDRVVITLNIEGTEVRTAAEVRTSHPGMGMGLKFSDLADSDRSHLRALLSRLGHSGTDQIDLRAEAKAGIGARDPIEEDEPLRREHEKRRHRFHNKP